MYRESNKLTVNQMNFEFHDIVGSVGVAMIVSCFFLLQLDKMDAEKLSYSVINLFGAILILISLSMEFNLSAALMQSVWVIISLIGIYRYCRSKKRQY